MASQIVLAWTVDVTNSTLGPAGAANAMDQSNVPLYLDPTTDPVLGQLFGLTVASDVSAASGPSTATRTLTLNMSPAAGLPIAPPPFQCHPRTSTPPTLPYPLVKAVPLPGSFFVSTGSMSVPTTMTQLPSLAIGDSIQFLSQQGVFYVVATLSPTLIGISTPFTGASANTGAFKETPAPATLVAAYSTSPLDTNGVATVPAIPPGSGAQSVTLSYMDSTGAGPFNTAAFLTGKRPVVLPLAGGSVDIAVIVDFIVFNTGGFGNSVGQITLVTLSGPLPLIPSNATPLNFFRFTDEAQMLIDRALVYLPPSYFALAQQGASAPQLEGDFKVTTGSINVPTTVDQTSALAAGNVIRFAEQQYQENRQLSVNVLYTITGVTPKAITLDRPFTGIDSNNTGGNQIGTNSDAGTMGNIGATVTLKPTGATLVSPSPAAPPTNDQLATPLGQFVALETAQPPLNPPLTPMTVPAPTFLSGLFTRTLELALTVPVVAQPIAFI